MDEKIDEAWRLIHAGDVDGARATVASVLADVLHALRDTIGNWEAHHLAGAIALLAMNVRQEPPTTRFLGLCLTDIALAPTPAAERNELLLPRPEAGVTYQHLFDELRKVYPTRR